MIRPLRPLPFTRLKSTDDFCASERAAGLTVNDVVMASCAGALRRYLEKHDALPAKSLVAMVPVSIRTGEEEDPWTNRVSGLASTGTRSRCTR